MTVVVLQSGNVSQILTKHSIVVIDLAQAHCDFGEPFLGRPGTTTELESRACTTVTIRPEPELVEEPELGTSPLVMIAKNNPLFSRVGAVSDLALEDILENIRAVDRSETF